MLRASIPSELGANARRWSLIRPRDRRMIDVGSRTMMAAAKKSKKGGTGAAGGGSKQLDKKMLDMLKLLDAKPTPMPELTPEEQQRNFEIGRRYNSKMATRRNKQDADLTMKIKLKDDAIENLPELLQHAARQVDKNTPPLNRRIATYTPPIPNFDPSKFDLDDEADDKEAALDAFRGGY